MYLEYFKFTKSPFHITPDPDFLFLSPSHKEASASIFYGIETRKGFIAVTGEVGVGKTTILRSYLEGTDPEKIRIVYIFNAILTFERLLKQICSELGLGAPVEEPAELVDLLLHYLVDEYRNDRNVVLIIDEAQNMPVQTLERLRMLSNLETSRDKLIQIILVGQPEFESRLELPELRQLKQRIAIRSRIESLTEEESVAYVQHRLMRASSFHNEVFSQRALKRIVKMARGIPRTINILCDNALVTAYGYQRKRVDHRIVKEVAGDFAQRRTRWGWGWKIIFVPVLAGCVWAAFWAARATVTGRANLGPGKRVIGAGPLRAIIKSGKTQPVDSGVKFAKGTKEEAAATAGHQPETPVKPKASRGAEGLEKAARNVPGVTTEAGNAAAGPVKTSAPKDKPGLGAPTVANKDNKPAVEKRAKSEDEAPAPVTAPPVSPPGPQAGHAVTVRQGDSVSKLLIGIYGGVSDDKLLRFKELNPRVRDINKIMVGEKIVIP